MFSYNTAKGLISFSSLDQRLYSSIGSVEYLHLPCLATMLVADVFESTKLEAWLSLIGAITVVHIVSLRYRNGLGRFNGPFLASFTNLWRMCHAYSNNYRAPMVHLHEQYGDVVRVGPNVLSFAQPQAIKDIYGPGKVWAKVCTHSFDGD